MIKQDLDQRCLKIVNSLLSKDGYLSLQEIAMMNDVSRRTVYYDIDRINILLTNNNIDKLNVVRGKGIILSDNDKAKLSALLTESESNDNYFSPKTRVKLIICNVLRRNKTVLIEDFMDICNVSRNTIINDIKVVQRILGGYDLEFNYSQKEGYHIVGNVIRKRAVFFLYFNELYLEHRIDTNFIDEDDAERIRDIADKLYEIEDELNYEYVDGVLYSLAVFFANIEYRKDPLLFEEKDVENIIITNEFKLVARKFDHLSSFEQVYMTLHLLGSRLQNVNFEGDSRMNEEAYDLACDLVEEFERLATVEFKNPKELEQALHYHLNNSLYRYRYGILIGNPLLDDIKREYGYLFNLTKKAVESIEQQLALPIHDSEIAYLTLHFGGALNNQQEEPDIKKIILVCPNGVSTVNMLKAEISGLIRNDNEIRLVSVDELEDYTEPYDIIITTIENLELKAEDREKVIVVNTILDDMDRLVIMKKCMSQVDNDTMRIDKLMNTISPYIKEDKLEIVKKEVFRFLDKKNLNTYSNTENVYEIVDFIKDEDLVVFNHQKNVRWQDSIAEVCELLEDKGYINRFYQKNIIRQLRKYGPYMFISEGVCLAHTKISDGSLKLGLSLGIYPEGVEFERGRVAKLVFVLSAEDQSKHLKILSDLIRMFDDINNVNRIVEQKSKKDVLEIFRKNAEK